MLDGILPGLQVCCWESHHAYPGILSHPVASILKLTGLLMVHSLIIASSLRIDSSALACAVKQHSLWGLPLVAQESARRYKLTESSVYCIRRRHCQHVQFSA